jgi:RNA polymerase sigma-54 factor
MVSVLALNKLELKEMINTEMVENPVLEEVEESAVTIEERSAREGERERSAEEIVGEKERVEKDPFDEVDFGSYFQDYLDPGFRTASNFEDIERPSFENFLSQPGTLTDHLDWQLGSMSLTRELRLAADLVVGNLNEDGYLTASDDELADALLQARGPARTEPIPFERGIKNRPLWDRAQLAPAAGIDLAAAGEPAVSAEAALDDARVQALSTVLKARSIVNQLDPIGVGARDLRECLLIQIEARRREAAMAARRAAQSSRFAAANDDASGFPDTHEVQASGSADPLTGIQDAEGRTGVEDRLIEDRIAVEDRPAADSRNAPLPRPQNEAGGAIRATGKPGDIFEIAAHIITSHLALLQKKDMRELTRGCGRSAAQVQAAVDLIRTLDPRPGQRYNISETRLIEPDVAFVKRDGEYVVLMNEEDMPTLRLSHAYRKMLRDRNSEKDVREYVKERYKSAIQLLRNIEQRKNTIVRTCEVIVRRQQEFLERGEQGLRPMMIKEVAEEIGVHPSTVSRAVANKYVHTSQGVYELRFFFSEGVNGPEGGDLPLVLLKRKVKKLIEEEDPRKPLTDDQLAAELQRQGIRVTRRTVAKYREDLQIPSTHQRRVR